MRSPTSFVPPAPHLCAMQAVAAGVHQRRYLAPSFRREAASFSPAASGGRTGLRTAPRGSCSSWTCRQLHDPAQVGRAGTHTCNVLGVELLSVALKELPCSGASLCGKAVLLCSLGVLLPTLCSALAGQGAQLVTQHGCRRVIARPRRQRCCRACGTSCTVPTCCGTPTGTTQVAARARG